MNLILISIGLGLLAVIYGVVTRAQVLGASTGNEKMQEIAGAIQEGAQAYLNRQYTTIAMVGVVVAIIVGIFLGVVPAVGFVVGGLMRVHERNVDQHEPSASSRRPRQSLSCRTPE